MFLTPQEAWLGTQLEDIWRSISSETNGNLLRASKYNLSIYLFIEYNPIILPYQLMQSSAVVHKYQIQTCLYAYKKISKRWSVCLGTGLDIQLNYN